MVYYQHGFFHELAKFLFERKFCRRENIRSVAYLCFPWFHQWLPFVTQCAIFKSSDNTDILLVVRIDFWSAYRCSKWITKIAPTLSFVSLLISKGSHRAFFKTETKLYLFWSILVNNMLATGYSQVWFYSNWSQLSRITIRSSPSWKIEL